MPRVTPGTMRRREPVYTLALALLRLYVAVFFRLRVEGRLPQEGPLIVAANHVSYTDPVTLGVTLDSLGRRGRFLTTAAVFALPVVGFAVRQARFIRVEPGHGRDTLSAALDALRSGEVVVVYPEGHIAADGVTYRPKRGVAQLARLSGAPVVPVAQWGMHRAPRRLGWLRRRGAGVVVGEPLDDLPAEDQAAADLVVDAIGDLLPRARALASHPQVG